MTNDRMIAFLTLELHIEAAQSIKDRRQVVRSLKDRLRTTFNVSVAELDGAELWNRATIGVVSISHSRDYLDGLMKNVERAATRIANNNGAEGADSFVEFLKTPVATAASAVPPKRSAAEWPQSSTPESFPTLE